MSDSVEAEVIIPFEDAEGSHAKGTKVTLLSGSEEEIANLGRLVDYGIVAAAVPGRELKPPAPEPEPEPAPTAAAAVGDDAMPVAPDPEPEPKTKRQVKGK